MSKKDLDLEDFLNQIPGLPSAPKQTNSEPTTDNGGWREIDLTSRFTGMLQGAQELARTAPMGRPQQDVDISSFGLAPSGGQKEMVYLREGQKYYKRIPASEAQMEVAIYAGPIANVTGKEFIKRGSRKFYVVEDHRPVDFSNPDYSKMRVLYEVEAPWVGTILVPESAIVGAKSGPKVLKG